MTSDTALRRFARSLRYDARNIIFALKHCRRPLSVIADIVARKREPTATLRDGTTITAQDVRTLLWLLDEIFIDRSYERGDVCIRTGDIVVDIGAHVGMFAIRASRLGAARVIACEPSPDSVRLLGINLAQNELGSGRVTVVEAAVGDHEGEATLALAPMSAGNVVVGIAHSAPGQARTPVRMTTLEALMHEHGLDRIGYLKVDCEGSEGAMLGVTPDDVLRRVDRIALEYHDEWSSLDHRHIADRLGRVGFRVTVVPQRDVKYGMIYASRGNDAGE